MLPGGGGFSAFTTCRSRPEWQRALRCVAFAGDVSRLICVESSSEQDDDGIAHGDAPLCGESVHLVVEVDWDTGRALTPISFGSASGLPRSRGHDDTVGRIGVGIGNANRRGVLSISTLRTMDSLSSAISSLCPLTGVVR